ncbi:hypothetical protein HMPREF0673_00890 [Leyella stercorea DSM 18206]|uniref:Uncharacterized protein n=1 Tax=Leyella stercorea DSM 18206 TaxID=1002367 RepID=G6AW92_9BACT|nr:hypothetical protein HMPREF0673_00890 [Leyella stercorea DSM 18206]
MESSPNFLLLNALLVGTWYGQDAHTSYLFTFLLLNKFEP